jgi:hypothetical protein
MKIPMVIKLDLRLYKVRRIWRIEGKMGENRGVISGKFVEGSPKLKRYVFINPFEYTINLPGQPCGFGLSGQVC